MPRFSGYRSAGLWYSGTDWDPWGEECHKLPVRGPGTAGQTGQRCKTWSTKGNIGGGGRWEGNLSMVPYIFLILYSMPI